MPADVLPYTERSETHDTLMEEAQNYHHESSFIGHLCFVVLPDSDSEFVLIPGSFSSWISWSANIDVAGSEKLNSYVNMLN